MIVKEILIGILEIIGYGILGGGLLLGLIYSLGELIWRIMTWEDDDN